MHGQRGGLSSRVTQTSPSPAKAKTAQHSTAQHSTAQHSTAQHSTAHLVHVPPLIKRPGQVGGALPLVGVGDHRRQLLVNELQLHRPAVQVGVAQLVDAHAHLVWFRV